MIHEYDKSVLSFISGMKKQSPGCFNKCIYSCKKRWQYFNRNKKKKLSYTPLSEKCAFLFPWMNSSLDFLEREKHCIYRELTYVAFLFEGLN